MAKEQPITIDGIIKETLPSAMFRVEVEIGGKAHEVLAHVSGKMRMHFIKILPGDVVTLEISPYEARYGCTSGLVTNFQVDILLRLRV